MSDYANNISTKLAHGLKEKNIHFAMKTIINVNKPLNFLLEHLSQDEICPSAIQVWNIVTLHQPGSSQLTKAWTQIKKSKSLVLFIFNFGVIYILFLPFASFAPPRIKNGNILLSPQSFVNQKGPANILRDKSQDEGSLLLFFHSSIVLFSFVLMSGKWTWASLGHARRLKLYTHGVTPELER